MKWEVILSMAIPLFLVVSFAQNTRVETKDVQSVQRLEQVISGHVTDLNGKYKFRVSEVTYQPGGYVGDHNHAGPGVRGIMAGEFTYVKGDKTTVYKAGDAFFEPGDVTHRAYNRGSAVLKVMNIEILPADFSGSALIPPRALTPRASEDVKAVKLVMAELTAAELRYNVKAVDGLLDEDFIYVGNDGSLTSRIDFIRLTDRERNPLDLLEITDVEVRTTGDTAIATGLIHEKGRLDGRPYEFRGRTLTTFVRESGRWRCLAIHD